MKKYKALFTILLSFNALAVDNTNLSTNSLVDEVGFTLYLARHAEKQSGKDPQLTKCGLKRATQLATLLSKVKLEAIYSTNYQRTLSTAEQSAKLHKLPVTNYIPSQLKEFSEQLKLEQKNTLIIGHSNTTPELVSLLINKQVAPLTEQDYQYLYQINFSNNKAKLTILTQPLRCNKN